MVRRGGAAPDGEQSLLAASFSRADYNSGSARRRSASFMLSPTTGAGMMSPVLTHAAQLAAAAAAAREAPPSTPPRPRTPDRATGQGGEPDQASLAGGPSAAFLSLSPTMQWLHVSAHLRVVLVWHFLQPIESVSWLSGGGWIARCIVPRRLQLGAAA